MTNLQRRVEEVGGSVTVQDRHPAALVGAAAVSGHLALNRFQRVVKEFP
jgi:hypothetical protein